MRRAALFLVAALGLLVPAEAHAQFSTRAVKEFENALTNAGRFGVPRYPTASLPICTVLTRDRGAVVFDITTLSLKVCDGSSWSAVGGAGSGPYDVGGATSAFNRVEWNTTQTPDTGMFLTGTTGNSWVIAERQDNTFDFAHAAQTNPTLFGHSSAQGTTEWWSLTYIAGQQALFNTGNWANGISFGSATGTNYMSIYSGSVVAVPSNGVFGWTNAANNSFGTVDTTIRRTAAAKLQMGADINGTGVDQSFTGPNGITGTDTIGGQLKHASGLGTGAGVSHPYETDRQVTKATGTTAQTYAPATIACPTKILSNTSATLTNIASITTTSTTGGSVTYDYTVIANNGTLQDVDGGVVKVSWGNNAGTVTSTMTAVTLQSDADASGTLAATPTRTDATNVVSINLTPTWVTIVPTSVTAFATFTVATVGDTVTCK